MIRALALALMSCTVLSAAALPEHFRLRAKEQSLLEVLQHVAKQCDAGLVARDQLSAELKQTITIDAREVSWIALRQFMIGYNIDLQLQDDRLELRDHSALLSSHLQVRSYDVRALTWNLSSFPSPSLATPEPGGSGAQLIPAIQEEDGTDISFIIDYIISATPDAWELDGTGINELDGRIIAVQLPEVQEQISACLLQLEQEQANTLIMQAWKVPADQVEPDALTLDANTWATLRSSLSAPQASWLSANRQRQHLFAGMHVPYVADLDVIGSNYAPIISIRSVGLSIDCEATNTHAGILVNGRFGSVADQTGDGQALHTNGLAISTISTLERHWHLNSDSRLIPHGGAGLYRDASGVWALAPLVKMPSARD